MKCRRLQSLCVIIYYIIVCTGDIVLVLGTTVMLLSNDLSIPDRNL